MAVVNELKEKSNVRFYLFVSSIIERVQVLPFHFFLDVTRNLTVDRYQLNLYAILQQLLFFISFMTTICSIL